MPTPKNIAIFVGVASIFVLIYFIFLRSPSDEGATLISSSNTSSASLLVTTTSSMDPVLANDFLSLLLSIKSIKLDDAIFANSAFISLHDSSITLVPDGNEGRINPFAPIGTDIVVPPPASPATLPTTPPVIPSPTLPASPPATPAVPKI